MYIYLTELLRKVLDIFLFRFISQKNSNRRFLIIYSSVTLFKIQKVHSVRMDFFWNKAIQPKWYLFLFKKFFVPPARVFDGSFFCGIINMN